MVKKSICNAEDTGDADSILGLRRAPGGGHDSPLQYSCLENLMDRAEEHGWYSPQGHKELDITEVTEYTRLYRKYIFISYSKMLLL